MAIRNNQWLLASRPRGWVQESDFRLQETEVPPLQDGQVLIKVSYLSLDPYMRGRMNETRSYAPPQPLGAVMIGGTVGEVLESRHSSYKAGETVVGMGGWQQYFVSNGEGLMKADTRILPPSVYLGCVGMTGVTAWYGLNKIGQPKAGQTVVVSAASGAVGSVVGQLAKAQGCRAVGVAGGKTKCDYVVGELGFDACVDYRSQSFLTDLEKATQNGVDVLFENVGGAVLDATLARMNDFGRIIVCGLVGGYNGQEVSLKNFGYVLARRLRVEAFIVSEHREVWPEALKELGALVVQGSIKYHETIAQGIESAPRAFVGLLRGENLGKQLVKM
jgi:NADPH-dependent curcumin reductase CurA